MVPLMSDIKTSSRLATFLSHITLIAAIALPVAAGAIWLFWNDLPAYAAGNLQHVYDVRGLGVGARFVGFGLFLAGAAIQAYGLLGVRRTFLEAAEGRAHSARAISGFRRFAWVSLIMVFVGIVQRTGLVMILSMSDPSHQGALSVQFGTNELKALFMGLLLVFVAYIFMEGKQAKDENEAFL